MNFKLVSKNNVGVVLVLLLVIILSQHKTLNFLIDTYLGRIFLIFMLLVVSYCNQMLGIVFVFLIIISVNTNISSGYFEGLTTTTEPKREMVINDVVLNAQKNNPNMGSNTALNDAALQQVVSSTPSTTSSTTTSTTPSTTTTSTTTPSTTTPSTTTPSTTTEGFSKNLSKRVEGIDMIDAENYIKRGKQSNSIHVNSSQRSSENVSPIDSTSLFKTNFSTF